LENGFQRWELLGVQRRHCKGCFFAGLEHRSANGEPVSEDAGGERRTVIQTSLLSGRNNCAKEDKSISEGTVLVLTIVFWDVFPELAELSVQDL
jgi:hypothetical protein